MPSSRPEQARVTGGVKPGVEFRIEVGSKSDVGRVRENNEDSFRVVPELNLWILSDGMGGVAHGEVASALAIETIAAYCHQEPSKAAASSSIGELSDLSATANHLAEAARAANHKIYESAARNPEQHGMGATVVAAQLEGRRLSVMHVGDSRAYLMRSGTLVPLTEDHSLVAEQVRRGVLTQEEAEHSRLQNVLVRALGVRDDVEPDASDRELLPGDFLLLCTDGLTRGIPDPEIAQILASSANPQAAVDRLIETALERGGEDNITAIVVRFAPNS
jgi:serine/threonine protein phosphatase PrpC